MDSLGEYFAIHSHGERERKNLGDLSSVSFEGFRNATGRRAKSELQSTTRALFACEHSTVRFVSPRGILPFGKSEFCIKILVLPSGLHSSRYPANSPGVPTPFNASLQSSSDRVLRDWRRSVVARNSRSSQICSLQRFWRLPSRFTKIRETRNRFARAHRGETTLRGSGGALLLWVS